MGDENLCENQRGELHPRLIKPYHRPIDKKRSTEEFVEQETGRVTILSLKSDVTATQTVVKHTTALRGSSSKTYFVGLEQFSFVADDHITYLLTAYTARASATLQHY